MLTTLVLLLHVTAKVAPGELIRTGSSVVYFLSLFVFRFALEQKFRCVWQICVWHIARVYLFVVPFESVTNQFAPWEFIRRSIVYFSGHEFRCVRQICLQHISSTLVILESLQQPWAEVSWSWRTLLAKWKILKWNKVCQTLESRESVCLPGGWGESLKLVK